MWWTPGRCSFLQSKNSPTMLVGFSDKKWREGSLSRSSSIWDGCAHQSASSVAFPSNNCRAYRVPQLLRSNFDPEFSIGSSRTVDHWDFKCQVWASRRLASSLASLFLAKTSSLSRCLQCVCVVLRNAAWQDPNRGAVSGPTRLVIHWHP